MTKFMKSIIILSAIMLAIIVNIFLVEGIYLLVGYGFFQLIYALFTGAFNVLIGAYIMYTLSLRGVYNDKPFTYIRKYKAFAIQYEHDKDMIYNNFLLLSIPYFMFTFMWKPLDNRSYLSICLYWNYNIISRILL